MKWLTHLFTGKTNRNPALKKLYQNRYALDPRIQGIIPLLPKTAEAMVTGGEYLYRKIIQEVIEAYDQRYQLTVLTQIDEAKRSAMIRTLMSFMLFIFFSELSKTDPTASLFLTNALHFEIYHSLPARESFVDYLNYRNPNFEDPKLAPTFKFGNDIAQIVGVRDIPFSFAIAQQIPIISEATKTLIHLAIVNEPATPPAL